MNLRMMFSLLAARSCFKKSLRLDATGSFIVIGDQTPSLPSQGLLQKLYCNVKTRRLATPRFIARIGFGKRSARGSNRCRHVARALHDDLVQATEIGLGRSDQRVRIGRT